MGMYDDRDEERDDCPPNCEGEVGLGMDLPRSPCWELREWDKGEE
jgi:hypothetical protein